MSKNKKSLALKEAEKANRNFNVICAILCLTLLTFFFVNFLFVSEDNRITAEISGFKMAFLLFGDNMRLNGGIVKIINNNNSGTVAFTSIMSLICIVLIVILASIFAYRAIAKKPFLSKKLYVALGVVFISLLALVIVNWSLESMAKKYISSGCALCVTKSFAIILPIIYLIFVGAYVYMGSIIQDKYN